jgi:hypothetical protein
MTTAVQPFRAVELPNAPPVTTVAATPLRRPKAPAVALLVLGVLMVLGPIVGGMFAKTAAGNQMINEFAPYMQSSALARYGRDIQVLNAGAVGIDAIYSHQDIATGQFPGLDEFRRDSPAVVGRASELLRQVKSAQGDFQQVTRIGGFDRIPFLIVAGGLVEIYGACVLLAGRRSRAKSAAVLVVLAAVAVGIYPFVSNLSDGSLAGQRMLHSLSPVMTPHKVRQLQEDFIVLVNVDGELSTTFRGVPQPGPADTAVTTLVKHWPGISSDLASLVGAVNDNISNYDALDDLDRLTHDVGLSGLGAFPWVLVGIGAVGASLAIGAFPRRGKESS